MTPREMTTEEENEFLRHALRSIFMKVRERATWGPEPLFVRIEGKARDALKHVNDKSMGGK